MEQESSSSEERPKNQAMSFSVGFDELPKNHRRMPKHLSDRTRQKPELSEARLAEKQKLAEMRRKVRYRT